MGKKNFSCGGLVIAAVFSLASLGASAQTQTCPTGSDGSASFADLSLNTSIVSLGQTCGYFSGNVLNNSNANLITNVLDFLVPSLNLSYSDLMEKVDSSPADFNRPLKGFTVLGVHWGGPGGGKTGFYSFYVNDYLVGLDSILINVDKASGLNGVSGVALFTTAVPEPEIYALMAVGLGVLGFAARRRRKVA